MNNVFEHLWKYFELHSAQRMTMINYYLIIIGALSSAIAVTIQSKNSNFTLLGVLLSILMILTSFIFWKIDERTSFLIKHAEEKLKYYERKYILDTKQHIFDTELIEFNLTNIHRNSFNKIYTYGKLYKILFRIVSLLAFLGLMLSILRFLDLIII